jgi:hypothetical protein
VKKAIIPVGIVAAGGIDAPAIGAVIAGAAAWARSASIVAK